MKTTIDYSRSETPAFDAVEDIRRYLGDEYDKARATMSQVRDPREFNFGCMILGISGLPVRAWYDHFWGEGRYMAERVKLEREEVK